VAEWLRSGLQSRVHRFDSGRRLSGNGRTSLNGGAAAPRLRSRLSLLLVLVGAVALFAGLLAAHARIRFVENEDFADRAVDALEGEGVRRAIELELAGALLEDAPPARRRRVESVIDDVIRSDDFQAVFRDATIRLHRVFYELDDPAALRLDGAIRLVDRAVRTEFPELGGAARRQLDAEILTLRRGRLAGDAVAGAESTRVLGIVLPLAALAAFLAAVAISPLRRRALLWVGVATAVVGGLVAASVPLARTELLSRLDAARELSTEQVRDAAGEVFDAYSAGLLTWALVLALAGIAVAAAALAAGLLHRGSG
jgi:hypothetical protein